MQMVLGKDEEYQEVATSTTWCDDGNILDNRSTCTYSIFASNGDGNAHTNDDGDDHWSNILTPPNVSAAQTNACYKQNSSGSSSPKGLMLIKLLFNL